MTELTDLCNFADTAFHAGDSSSLKDFLDRVEHDAKLAIESLECNYMKLNDDQCHLTIFGLKIEAVWAKTGLTKI